MFETYFPESLHIDFDGSWQYERAQDSPTHDLAKKNYEAALKKIEGTPLEDKLLDGRYAGVPVVSDGDVLYTEAITLRFAAGNGFVLDVSSIWDSFADEDDFKMIGHILSVVGRLSPLLKDGMSIDMDNSSDQGLSSAQDLFWAEGDYYEKWGFELVHPPLEKQISREGELFICGPFHEKYYSVLYERIGISFSSLPSPDDIKLIEGMLPDIKELSALVPKSHDFHFTVWKDDLMR